MPSVPNSFIPNSVISSAAANENFQTIAAAILPTFVFTIAGTLTTGTNLTHALIINNALTINKVYAYVKTAPTGANIIIDINKNGVSVWNSDQSNRLNIVAAAQSGNQTIFDTTSLAEDDILTIDLDQVGSTVSGQDITIEVKCT